MKKSFLFASFKLLICLAFVSNFAVAKTIAKDSDAEMTKESLGELLSTVTDDEAGLFLKNLASLQDENPKLSGHKKELLESADDPAKRTQVGRALREIGLALKGTGGLAVRATSDIAIASDLLITLPFRTVYKFFRGTITGESKSPNRRTLYDVTDGSDSPVTAGLGAFELLQAAKLAAAGEAGAALMGAVGWITFSPSVDYLATRHCSRLDRNKTVDQRKVAEMQKEVMTGHTLQGRVLTGKEIARREEKIASRKRVIERSDHFCKNQQTMKDGVRDVTDLGQKGGAKVHDAVKKVFKKKPQPVPSEVPTSAPTETEGAGSGQ